MIEIPAKTIYIDPQVRELPNCNERLERMLPHFQCDDVRDLDGTAYAEVRQAGHRRHGKDDFGDDALVAFIPYDEERTEWYYHWRDAGRLWSEFGEHCQSALELNLVSGCVFRCAYCGFGRSVVFSLDVERFMAGLDDVFAQYPDQGLYKFSNMTDLPPFEPELNALPPMIERFSQELKRYLMMFTKSNNVDWLLDLDHGGHTIISWSMSSHTASRLVDKRTATMEERIEAMAKCQADGYRVRARMSPIVPVKNWREEYRDFFEKLFAAATPDVVTLELLGWFDFADLEELIPLGLLDDDAVDKARAAADDLRGVRQGPFTQETHLEVYHFCVDTVKELSPSTPVGLCHGTPPVWAEIGPKVGMEPKAYVCNCAGTSCPGFPVYDRFHGTP